MAWPAWLATVTIGQPRRAFAIAGRAMIDSDERVILVTETDVELGEAPKLDCFSAGRQGSVIAPVSGRIRVAVIPARASVHRTPQDGAVEKRWG